MEIKTREDFFKALETGPYAWPGGYPLFFVTSDGAALSFESAENNSGEIADSIERGLSDGWRVVGLDINYEDADLICDDTGKPIDCAYCD